MITRTVLTFVDPHLEPIRTNCCAQKSVRAGAGMAGASLMKFVATDSAFVAATGLSHPASVIAKFAGWLGPSKR